MDNNISATTVPPQGNWLDDFGDTVKDTYEAGKSFVADYKQSNFEIDDEKQKQIRESYSTGGDSMVFDNYDDPYMQRGMFAKNLRKKNPGISDEQIAETIGVNANQMRFMNAGKAERLVAGNKYDTFMIRLGVANMAPNNPLTQKALAASNKLMDVIQKPGEHLVKGVVDPSSILDVDTVAEMKAYMKDYESGEKMWKGVNTTYDEAGSRSVPLNIAGAVGEMAHDIEGGLLAGMRGSAMKMFIKDMGVTGALETARYAQHLDEGRLAMGIGGALAGNVVGNMISKAFRPDVQLPVEESKSIDALNDQLKFLELFDDSKIQVTPELIDNPKAFKQQIEATIENPHEKDRMLEAVDHMKSGMVNQINTMTKALGTSPAMLRKFQTGKVSDREMGKEFKRYMTGLKTEYGLQADVLYKKARESDVDPKTGKERTYTLDIIDDIRLANEATRGPYSVWTNILKHEDKMENEKSRGIKKSFEALTKKRDEWTEKFAKQSEALNSLEVKAGNDFEQHAIYELKLREQMSEGSNASQSAIDTTELNIKKYAAKLKSNKTELTKLRGSKVGTQTQLRNTWDEMNDLNHVMDDTYSSGEFTAHQMSNIVKMLNNKIYVKGGIISSDDQAQIRSLTSMRERVKTFMAENITESDYMKTYGEASDLMSEKFHNLGGQSRVQNISKAMENKKDPEAMYKLVTHEEEGLNNLVELKTMLGKDNTMYKSLVAKKYSDIIMKDVEKTTGIKEAADINMDKLARNLNKPYLMDEIEEVAGKEVADTYRGIKYFANAYEQLFTEIAKVNPVLKGGERGMKRKFKDLVSTMFKDTVELVGDAVTGKEVGDASRSNKWNPRWYDKTVEMNELIGYTKERLGKAKSQTDAVEILDTAAVGLNKLMKGIKKKADDSPEVKTSGSSSSAFVTKEATSVIAGGGVGAGVGAAAAPEGHKAEGAAVGFLMGAGVGASVTKKYDPNTVNSIGFSKGSSDTQFNPDAVFDTRNFNPEDVGHLSSLKAGEYATDNKGNTFQKSREMNLVEADRDASKEIINFKGPLSKAPTVPGKQIQAEGKVYDVVESDKWTPSKSQEHGRQEVTSHNTTDTGDYTKRVTDTTPAHEFSTQEHRELIDDLTAEHRAARRTRDKDLTSRAKGVLLTAKGASWKQVSEVAVHTKAIAGLQKNQDTISTQIRDLTKSDEGTSIMFDIDYLEDELGVDTLRLFDDPKYAKGIIDRFSYSGNLEEVDDIQKALAKYKAHKESIPPQDTKKADELKKVWTKQYKEIQHNKEAAESIVDSVESAYQKGKGATKSESITNPGTSFVSSPLNDMVSTIRDKGIESQTAAQWKNSFKDISSDEMEGSRVGQWLDDYIEDFGGDTPLSTNNIEQVLLTRQDAMTKVEHTDKRFNTIMVDEKGRPSSSEDVNLYFSKTGADVKWDKSADHFKSVTHSVEQESGEARRLFGHTRGQPYVYTPESGGKGKVLAEIQSDKYQHLTGETAIEVIDSETGSAKYTGNGAYENLRDDADSALNINIDKVSLHQIIHKTGDEDDIYERGTDAVINIAKEVDRMMDKDSLYADGGAAGIAEEIVTRPYMSIKDLSRLLRDNGVKVNSSIRRVQQALVTETAEALSRIPTGKTGNIPYENKWPQALIAEELVDAYNKGFTEISIPIGRMEYSGKRINTQGAGKSASSPANDVEPESSFNGNSGVESNMVRTAGVTRYYAETIKPLIEKAGGAIKSSDVVYNDETQMLTIKVPETPFTLTRQLSGENPGSSKVKTKISNTGKKAFTDKRTTVERFAEKAILGSKNGKKYTGQQYTRLRESVLEDMPKDKSKDETMTWITNRIKKFDKSTKSDLGEFGQNIADNI